jgi:hypothetical protein
VSLNALVGFVSVGGSNNSSVNWLIVLLSENEAKPTIRLRRTVLLAASGRSLDKKKANASISMKERNEPGAAGESSTAEIELQLTGKPQVRALRHTWEVEFSTPPARGTVRFEVSAKQGDEPFKLLAEHDATAQISLALGANGEFVRKFKLQDFPRLCFGLQQAKPNKPPRNYRGLSQGDGDPAKLIEHLNSAVLPGAPSAPAGKALQSLLYHLFVQLDSPNTLDPAWDQQSEGGNSSFDLSDAMLQADPVRTADELWARHVTEMASFTRYGNPSSRYGGKSVDAEFDADSLISSSNNPRYGLSLACQNLASLSTATRLNLDGGQTRVIASGIFGAFNATQAGATWFSADVENPLPVEPSGRGDPASLGAGPTKVDITHAIAKVPEYGPGTVHLFSNRAVKAILGDQAAEASYRDFNKNPQSGAASYTTITLNSKGKQVVKEMTTLVGADGDKRQQVAFDVRDDGQELKDNQDNPHIGFVLRVRRHPSDSERHRAQFLDTGGFAVAGRGEGLNFGGGMHSGIFDGPPARFIHSNVAKQPYRGFGVFPKKTPAQAKELAKNVTDVLQKARPLGFVRLVVVDRSLKKTAKKGILDEFKIGAYLYVSPLLTMYSNDDSADSQRSNYSIARLIWSLRDLPGMDKLEVRWYIYHPVGDLAREMLDAPRTKNAVDLATSVSSDPPSTTLRRLLVPIGELISDETGQVAMLGTIARKESPALFNKKIESRDDVAMDKQFLDRKFPQDIDLPPYFKP